MQACGAALIHYDRPCCWTPRVCSGDPTIILPERGEQLEELALYYFDISHLFAVQNL